MAITPKKVNQQELASSTTRNRALQAERQAFDLELDLEIASARGEDTQAVADRAKWARAEANAAKTRSKLPAAETERIHKEAIDQRLNSVESSYVQELTYLEIKRDAALPEDAPSIIDGRTIDQHEEQVAREEEAWNVLVAKLPAEGTTDVPVDNGSV